MDLSLNELRELVMDREAWRAAIHGITKSRTWLSDWTKLNWELVYVKALNIYSRHSRFQEKMLLGLNVKTAAKKAPKLELKRTEPAC